mmetsp:Transcript_67525/g.190353  ORF Transcript_67525/g.190353 Transcript_67525/m.190353 type:complete len:168 (+) Transcript_67525:80-583(+)
MDTEELSIHEYNISVYKGPGEVLGLDIFRTDGDALVIKRVQQGPTLVKDWNRVAPHCEVRPGDRIIEINGVQGDHDAMIRELYAEQAMFIRVVRMKTPLPRVLACSCGATMCAICHGEFKPSNIVIELPCKHAFCPSCIENWLTRYRSVCPLCMKPIRCEPEVWIPI